MRSLTFRELYVCFTCLHAVYHLCLKNKNQFVFNRIFQQVNDVAVVQLQLYPVQCGVKS